MKTIINKLRFALLVCLMTIVATAPVCALTLDVPPSSNTSTNTRVPVEGLYYDDNYQITQMIYPASLLTRMSGGTITSLTFYANNNITLTGGTFTIRLGTTNSSSFNSATRITTGMTAVATTNMTACRNGSQIDIPFTTPYNYTGGNLVVEFHLSTPGTSFNTTNFIGDDTYSNSSIYGKNSSTTPTSFTLQSFLPKATFNYISSIPIIGADPTALNFEVVPGSTANQTVNVEGVNLTGNITATLNDANGVFSVTPATLGSSGGNLTVTYSPSVVGTHTATVTLTSSGADPVTITLNGTCDNMTLVCDNTGESSYLPVYGYYFEAAQHNQMLYPASKIPADLIGKKITKISFFPTNGINFYYRSDRGNGTVTINVANMPEGTTGYASSNNTPKNPTSGSFTKVTTLQMPGEAQPNITVWEFAFDDQVNGFVYNGGDLLIDVVTEAGQYGGTTFAGESMSGYPGYCSYNSNSPGQQFLPKVRFDWEESTPITNGTVTPNPVDFGNVLVGSTATQTVTVRNTGNQPFTPTINATNLPQGITVSPTTSGQLAPGGTLNLTVNFTPTAETSYSGSFTVTIPVPDGEDIVVTVNVTGSGYVVSRTLMSNTVEIPVYKSEAKAPNATYVFSQDDVEGDTDMSLSYGNDADVKVDVLVKDDEPITSYDLRHKVGSGNWASAATATQDASNPKSYVYNNETFVIPSDATEMWLSMTDEGADASGTISYVPVTVANGVVTQGNTYGAPQVQASNDPISFIVSVGGSKSAGRPGGHWDQNGVDYCIYTPVVTIANINPAFDGENRTPYLIRAWLLENENVPFYSIVRVANENDPDNSHIEAGDELTYPYPLGEMYLESDMISEQYMIGHDWSGEGDDPWNNPWGDVEDFMENVFAAPSTIPTGEHMRIAVRIYYYKPGESVSGSQMLAANRDGDAPGDGYGYGEGEGNGEGIPTAVVGIYTDRQVVDVKYVNPQGLQSDRPFDGVNIIVTRYNDGSVTTSKVVK